jgi:hypothetical protein
VTRSVQSYFLLFICVIYFLCNMHTDFNRQGAAGGKHHKHDPERRSRESRAVPAPDANAELVSSLQVIYRHFLVIS